MKLVMRKEGPGFKKYGKPLIAPIIADQKHDDVIRRVAEFVARSTPKRLARSRRKKGKVDPIGHDDGIATAKVSDKLPGSVRGSRSEAQQVAAIDEVFQEAVQIVVK